MQGDPDGEIVYVVGSGGCGVPDVMNADLEKAFGTKMAMIRERAARVRQLLGDDLPIAILGISAPAEFTLRDEANAICAYAFRNGPIENIHADGRISDEEMKHLMIKACETMAKLLLLSLRAVIIAARGFWGRCLPEETCARSHSNIPWGIVARTARR